MAKCSCLLPVPILDEKCLEHLHLRMHDALVTLHLDLEEQCRLTELAATAESTQNAFGSAKSS